MSHSYGQVVVTDHGQAQLGDVHNHFHGDHLSIATSCVSLNGGVTNLMMRIAVFVSQVRAARKDMDAVSRELLSLQLCLGTLRDDMQQSSIRYSQTIMNDLSQVLVNCELVIQQIEAMLTKLSSGRLIRRIQWAATERAEMNKFRSSLEANKTALEIALTLGSIQMLAEQKTQIGVLQTDSSYVLKNTEVIISNTSTILTATTQIDEKLDTITKLQKDETKILSLGDEIRTLQQHITNLTQGSVSTGSTNTLVKHVEQEAQIIVEPLASIVPGKDEILDAIRRAAITESPDESGFIGDDAQHSMNNQGLKFCPACERLLWKKHEPAVEVFRQKMTSAKETWTQQLRQEKQNSGRIGQELAALRKEHETLKEAKGSPESTLSDDVRLTELKVALYDARQQIEKLKFEAKATTALAEFDPTGNNDDTRKLDKQLREKRTALNLLSTQSEIVLRELEVLVDHLRHAKNGGAPPVDINGEVNPDVVRHLTQSLDRLKESYAPQIESLQQQKCELEDRVTGLQRRLALEGPLGRMANSLIVQKKVIESYHSGIDALRWKVNDELREVHPDEIAAEAEKIRVKYSKVLDFAMEKLSQRQARSLSMASHMQDTKRSNESSIGSGHETDEVIIELKGRAAYELEEKRTELYDRLRSIANHDRNFTGKPLEERLEAHAKIRAHYAFIKRLYFEQDAAISKLEREFQESNMVPEPEKEDEIASSAAGSIAEYYDQRDSIRHIVSRTLDATTTTAEENGTSQCVWRSERSQQGGQKGG